MYSMRRNLRKKREKEPLSNSSFLRITYSYTVLLLFEYDNQSYSTTFSIALSRGQHHYNIKSRKINWNAWIPSEKKDF